MDLGPVPFAVGAADFAVLVGDFALIAFQPEMLTGDFAFLSVAGAEAVGFGDTEVSSSASCRGFGDF